MYEQTEELQGPRQDRPARRTLEANPEGRVKLPEVRVDVKTLVVPEGGELPEEEPEAAPADEVESAAPGGDELAPAATDGELYADEDDLDPYDSR